ncbi:hypothetical protein GLOIN_2v1867698 [Rhizophagus irregularis DAOM 181602=DAOM 197198]|nr:hypothetical protein GLOIN_2v1867698 [Rhizophagus irregularis DAOM 181602=DAOM 197198]
MLMFIAVIVPVGLVIISLDFFDPINLDLNSNGVPLRNYTVATSLTTLVMWIELLLLLRFFSGPANYINISLSIIRRSSYVKIDNVADSYFSNFWGAIMTVYFWINGRWDQVRSMTVASILLITVMQNMLVAFMTSVFDDARASGRQAVLKFRAELIYEYETLEKAVTSRENERNGYIIQMSQNENFGSEPTTKRQGRFADKCFASIDKEI